MVKILLKGGLPVIRAGAIVTVAVDGTGCGCCGPVGATCGTTPTDLTVDTTGAGYNTDDCWGYGVDWTPHPPIDTAISYQGGTCPDGYPAWYNHVYTFWLGFYGGNWHCEIRVSNALLSDYTTQWYGIKATGSSPLGTYVVDVTAYPDCGDPSEMTGTVVIT